MGIKELGRYAWRKYFVDGVSASGFNQPDTIDIFPFVDEIDAQIAALSEKVEGAEVGGIIGADTVSDLNALATALGLDADNKGRIGRVYADPDPANNGDWLWSGSAFEFVGAGALGDIQAATEPPFLSFAGPCIYDPSGVYGTAEAFYVPRSRWIRRNGEAAQSTLAGNTTNISGYYQLTNPSPGLGWSVYYDMDDPAQPYKAAGYPNGLPTGRAHRIILIAILRDTDMVVSAFDVLRSEDLQYDHLYFNRPVVVLRDTLLVPSFYYRSRVQTWTLISPADGASYWELPFFTADNNAERIYFDERAYSRGETPVKRVTGSTAPLAPSFRMPLILKAINGHVESAYPLAGLVPGGTDRNEFVYGAAGVDMMPTRFGDTSFANITNGYITPFGVTRGLTNSVTGRPYGGGYFKEKLKAGQSIFCRIFVQSGTDDNFGNGGRLYLFVPGSTSAVQTLALTLEKRLSARARIYSGYISANTLAGVDRFWLGMEGQTVPGFSLVTGGFQIAVGSHRVGWIDRYDFPKPGIASELLYPSALYCIEGRPLPFYPKQISQIRGDNLKASVSSIRADQRAYSLETQGLIDPSRLGANVDIVVRETSTTTDRRASRTVAVRKAASSVSGAKNVLMIGDSLTNYGVPSCVSDYLTALGMTPTFIGKYNSSLPGSFSTATDGVLAEGHPGWEWGDFTYAKTDRVTTLAVGSEASYEALSKADKLDVNTWLRNEVGSEASARNGKVFDPNFWRTRWSPALAVPDVVCINLGTNNSRDNDGQAVIDTVLDGLQVVIPALRSAWPSAEIILYFPPMAYTAEGGDRWPEHADVIKTTLEYVTGLADAKVNFVAAYAHASQEAGYELTLNATTSAGTKQTTVGDTIHFRELVQRQVAEAVAAAVVYEVGTNSYADGIPGYGSPVVYTIASGVLTLDGETGYVKVDTEGAAATDDLDSIVGGAVGKKILVQTNSSSRDVTVKNSASLVLRDGKDFVLDSTGDKIELIKINSVAWHEVSRSSNSSVSLPSSDKAIVRYNGTYGEIQNSLATIDDSGFLTAVGFRATSTSDASLTSTDHALQLGPTAGSNLAMDDNEMQSRNNGAAASFFINNQGGDLIVGNSSAILQLNGGKIKFPASQVASADANTLDDYEEYTFTPSIAFGGASVGVTYGSRSGRATKIGDQVLVSVALTLTAKGSSVGNATIEGISPAIGADVGFAVGIATSFTGLTGALVARAFSTASSIALRQTSSAGNVAITDAAFTATASIVVTGNYPV